MKERNKIDEIIDFLNDKVFLEELRYARKHNDKYIYEFASTTIKEMYNINSVNQLIMYYKNIIKCKSSKLKKISNYLKVRKIVRLEDIEKEFNRKFNSKWLSK